MALMVGSGNLWIASSIPNSESPNWSLTTARASIIDRTSSNNRFKKSRISGKRSERVRESYNGFEEIENRVERFQILGKSRTRFRDSQKLGAGIHGCKVG